MNTLRAASQEEVVSYYITSELKRFVEHSDREPELPPKLLKALGEAAEPFEGPLQHMSRALICRWRDHSWLYEQFWDRTLSRFWSLVEVMPNEIDVMPLGGNANEFHYPKLDQFVDELRGAA